MCKKGKADHAQMGIGRVLISLTLTVEPVSAAQTYGYQLPSKSQSITALWPVPNCTAW